MNAKLQLPDTQIDATEAGAELRANCLASKLQLKWLGVTRSLTADQMASLVDGSEVDSKMIRASKRLLDSAHPTMKLLANIRNRMLGTWRGLTLPFVEAGTRLIPRQLVGEFEARMSLLKDELASAVDELEQEWPRLKEAAAARLGTLYNPDDYPDNLEELFVVSWSYPDTSVPSYLMAIDAGVYRREAARVAEKFEQAVELAEQGFVEEFNKLVSHLTERLTDTDCERKIFRDSSLESLREFFQRFRQMRLGGRAEQQLEELVTQAQQIVSGVVSQDLRDSSSLRQSIAQNLARVGAELEGLMVARPRRKIVRMGGLSE
jgi:hypothetical protein